jgi:hypothetical protein
MGVSLRPSERVSSRGGLRGIVESMVCPEWEKQHQPPKRAVAQGLKAVGPDAPLLRMVEASGVGGDGAP